MIDSILLSGLMRIDKAAAGGLGSLLCQLCRRVGAFVIGTVSNLEKAKLAKENGILLHRVKLIH